MVKLSRKTLGIGCGSLVVLFVFFWIVGTLAPSEKKPKSAASTGPAVQQTASPTPTSAPVKSPGTAKASEPVVTPSTATIAPRPTFTAQQIVDALSRLYPLPNPTDNTGACAGSAGNTDGCVQLITTDSVSVYAFRTAAVSKRWVTAMKANGDWRQIDKYALAWTARDQALTSKEARGKMVAEVHRLVG